MPGMEVVGSFKWCDFFVALLLLLANAIKLSVPKKCFPEVSLHTPFPQLDSDTV